MTPLLLDLFCGAGGASMGLSRAGFDVFGVDIHPQPRYPHEDRFTQADAMEIPLDGFDAIWASPPCQRFSGATPEANREKYPDLIAPLRDRLRASGVPYVIENVDGAPLLDASVLRGDMFGLGVIRRRRFESNVLVMIPPMPSKTPVLGEGYVCVAGAWRNQDRRGPRERWTKPYPCDLASWSEAMGIDWMIRRELVQAVPPAYSEFLGRQLIRYVQPDALIAPGAME
jgi:DNA (cytosine-5)-methyltransferase 1